MSSTGQEQITAHDGREFGAFRAVPDSGGGPGVLLFQEIFGVNDNMRELAVRLADAGYLTLVPDVFWRIEPGFERKDESGLAEGMAMAQRLDREMTGYDMTSALAHLLDMDACTGKVGTVGFCLGGTLAYVCAASARVNGRGVDAVVPYYGSGIHELVGLAGTITAPIMFHYGDRDPYIPTEQVDIVQAAFAGRPDAVVHRYDSGHAFSNWDAPSMYDRPAAELAWDRSLAFFAEHLSP